LWLALGLVLQHLLGYVVYFEVYLLAGDAVSGLTFYAVDLEFLEEGDQFALFLSEKLIPLSLDAL
jgi:hypothetical protein